MMMSDGSKPARSVSRRYARWVDLDLPLDRVGLSALVERHHDDRGAVAADEPGLLKEIRLAFLERDGVDDRLALNALEPGFDHRPLRAVDHHRHPGDFRLGRDVVEERASSPARSRASPSSMFTSMRFAPPRTWSSATAAASAKAPSLIEPRKLPRAGDVGPLADHLEVAVGPDGERLEARQPRDRGRLDVSVGSRLRTLGPRPDPFDRLRHHRDVVRSGPATTAEDVRKAACGKVAQQARPSRPAAGRIRRTRSASPHSDRR